VVLRQGGDLAQVETFYSPQKGPGNCTRPLPSASEAEEEGLFKADAVNEEDPERDRAIRSRSLVRAGSVIAQRQTHIQKGKDCDKTSLKAANDPGSGARRAHE